MSASIPVLCYHSVAPGERIGPHLFEHHLRALVGSGLRSLCPEELGRAASGFLLTFDDGFADLWTHGLSLLLRYGIRATVFVIPSRTGEGEARPKEVSAFERGSTEAHSEASERGGPHPGFLRWSELSALEASGAVTVRSHSWAHAAGWVGEEIVGFHLGAESKTHWSLRQVTGGDDRLGIPLYRRGSALGHRLYRDDPGLRDHLAEWLRERGGAAYVADRGSEAVDRELRQEALRYRGSGGAGGSWETEGERRARTEEDLSGARRSLETRLGGCRDELCLPWGEYDAVTLECAQRVGIRRVYTLDRGPNPAGRIGLLVNRFEPRPKGSLWLRTRLWIYRSTVRARAYGLASGRGPEKSGGGKRA